MSRNVTSPPVSARGARSVVGRARREHWWASRPAWAALAVLAAVVLSIGSVHGRLANGVARASALDSIIKCPACEDLSIAQSDAPSSLALRGRVSEFVAEGWSDSRIESWVTARYGSDALLVPPGGGARTVLYLVPVAAVGIAVAGLGWYLWRRRSASVGAGGP